MSAKDAAQWVVGYDLFKEQRAWEDEYFPERLNPDYPQIRLSEHLKKEFVLQMHRARQAGHTALRAVGVTAGPLFVVDAAIHISHHL